MNADLTADDFAAFFKEVHGYDPFPWQRRLAASVAANGWPKRLDLPTGSGKTAAIDIAIFHLALEVARGGDRKAPLRIAFVVDRRLVVDDAFTRAELIARKLAEAAPHTVTAGVAAALRTLALDPAHPLVACRLRGGIPREDDWAHSPAQPTILCSTVDQVGSRLLFRGYGLSDSAKPIHAGLIGSDCLILLDEAHLAEPFRQTLDWVDAYRSDRWRDAARSHGALGGVVLLTATPRADEPSDFHLEDEDYKDAVLAARWNAAKVAKLIVSAKSKSQQDAADRVDGSDAEDGETGGHEADFTWQVDQITEEVRAALAHFDAAATRIDNPAIGVVVNRVVRARRLFERLEREFGERIGQPLLLIGPSRGVDRAAVEARLRDIRTRTYGNGEVRQLEKPILVVATQCIEAGVDIDLDGLITEVAPLDALRQRFGRLNRAGRNIVPYAAIVAAKSEIAQKHDDPVYAKAIKPTWDYLSEHAQKPAKKGGVPTIDFGLAGFDLLTKRAAIPQEAISPKSDAPILMPAHLDLLSQTAPVPSVARNVSLYLHGPDREPASVVVAWRADIEPRFLNEIEMARNNDDMRRLLMSVPVRSGETIELPLWAVRRWLQGQKREIGRLADLAEAAPEDDARGEREDRRRRVFRWAGDSDHSAWISAADIRPGDMIVVPASYGGVDKHGWDPDSDDPARDVAAEAAEPYEARHYAVRIAPGLLHVQAGPPAGETPQARRARQRAEQEQADAGEAALAERLASLRGTRGWRVLRDAISDLALPEEVKEQLASLDLAKGSRGRVEVLSNVYGVDEEERPIGIVFLAPLGLKNRKRQHDGEAASTEDDEAGSFSAVAVTLDDHTGHVVEFAQAFARAIGLPEERVRDLILAALLHDLGKADPRFQAWLYYGDPLGFDPDEEQPILAKSARFVPRAVGGSALPDKWRHEALSVRLATLDSQLEKGSDPDLVLWLIGTHHGYGRPFFPHVDKEDARLRGDFPGRPAGVPASAGPQSLVFDWNGSDWPQLFERLKARYGVWELARMEAILRLADHRASASERQKFDVDAMVAMPSEEAA